MWGLELGIASLFPFRVEGRSGAGVADAEFKVGWVANINSSIFGCREAAGGVGCNFAGIEADDDEDEAATDGCAAVVAFSFALRGPPRGLRVFGGGGRLSPASFVLFVAARARLLRGLLTPAPSTFSSAATLFALLLLPVVLALSDFDDPCLSDRLG